MGTTQHRPPIRPESGRIYIDIGVVSLVFLLTANKDEDAEQQRGAERPTGHPGVERYVDSASS